MHAKRSRIVTVLDHTGVRIQWRYGTKDNFVFIEQTFEAIPPTKLYDQYILGPYRMLYGRRIPIRQSTTEDTFSQAVYSMKSGQEANAFIWRTLQNLYKEKLI